MDAAMVTAIAALIAGPVAAAAAMYGQRGANRVSREASAVTGYDSLAQLLVAERNKAEQDQAAAERRADELELDNSRLRQMVRDLGGTP